jgi:DNA-binding MarR family transcriptional regulator
MTTGQDGGREINHGHLSTLLGFQLRKVYARLFETVTQTLQGLGLAPGQYSVLLLIGLNPGLSQMALAEAMRTDRTTLVPITARFARARWVRRTRRNDDRRVYCLELTPLGEAVLAKARVLMEAHERRFAAALSEEERTRARGLLARICDCEI